MSKHSIFVSGALGFCLKGKGCCCIVRRHHTGESITQLSDEGSRQPSSTSSSAKAFAAFHKACQTSNAFVDLVGKSKSIQLTSAPSSLYSYSVVDLSK